MGRPLGIVHRDVSPENVMVSARGEVKLLDFGVVKTSEGRVARTEMGVVKGNVTYMAPEQARGLDVDSRADLYSLALVLYMLAAGEPLYSEDTTYALLMKAGAGPGVEDRSAIRDLPQPLAAVIERATATRIEDRYPNARAMAADLEAAARNGAAATAALVVELFGADLKEESHRMATFAPARLDALRRPPVVGPDGVATPDRGTAGSQLQLVEHPTHVLAQVAEDQLGDGKAAVTLAQLARNRLRARRHRLGEIADRVDHERRIDLDCLGESTPVDAANVPRIRVLAHHHRQPACNPRVDGRRQQIVERRQAQAAVDVLTSERFLAWPSALPTMALKANQRMTARVSSAGSEELSAIM